MKRYRKESLLGPLFKLLEATFELFVPLVVAAIIDNGISSRNIPYIVKMCLLLAGLAIIGLSCSLTAQYFAAKSAVGTATQLRHALFSKLQGLSFTRQDKLGTSSMITRITSDVNQVQSGINLTLRLFLRSPFIVFGAMIMAFTIDVRSALIFAVAIPVLAAVVFGIMLSGIPLYRKVQQKLDSVLNSTRENLTGVRVLRAFCMEKKETEGFDDKTEALNVLQKFAGRISALMNPVTYLIINLALIALIYTGALRVNVGSLSQGHVVSLYSYLSQILVELIKLANLIITITKATACLGRVSSVLDIPDGVDADSALSKSRKSDSSADPVSGTAAKASDPFIVFDNVSFRYEGAGDDSLRGITFSVNKGETVGIIGGTGSGKSTLVQLIPSFYPHTTGSLTVDGADVLDTDAAALRSMIGYVPQHAELFQGTVRSNLLWGKPDADDTELTDALKAAQAYEIIKNKDGGIDAEVEQHGRNFSGGQKQRLTIARALVRQPQILILDDSSSALDYATDAALRSSLAKLPYNPTVFVVSQRAASVMHADKIIVLDDGEQVGCGTHDELMETCEVYREICASQLGKKEA